MPELISKTNYLQGLQCSKLLWHAFNNPAVFSEPSGALQHLFKQGHTVAKEARRRYNDGISIPPSDIDRVVELTREALPLRKPIFEAAARFGHVHARADILEPAKQNSWNLIEVKSSTEVKDVHLEDLAFQAYVFQRAGIPINECYIITINNRYERGGTGMRLLKKHQHVVTGQILAKIEDRIGGFTQVISMPQTPAVSIGAHCNAPYECAMYAHCWGGLPDDSVWNLYKGRKKSVELYEQGCHRMIAIPPSVELTPSQRIQQQVALTGAPHINKEAIQSFLSRLQYPLWLIDFETFATAVPMFAGVRPYQQIPFQFSIHVLDRIDAEPRNTGFLSSGSKDPRPQFLAALQEQIGTNGSVLAYNAQFESGVLRDLATRFPDSAAWISQVQGRMVDLLQPFRSFDYYHQRQKGSASLKAVLPALNGPSYDGMAIQDGASAGARFLQTHYEPCAEAEREQVRAELMRYCSQDTFGMSFIVKRLHEICAD
jgi:hypothetical protein